MAKEFMVKIFTLSKLNTVFNRRLALGVFVLFIFFFGLGRVPLYSGDEGRHAEIAREMLETGDFVSLRFNYVGFLEKPVLAFFLTALSFAVFGVNEFAARFPSVLAALLGLMATYIFTRKFFTERAAVLSVLILGGSVGYVLAGRFAMLDMLLNFFMSTALFCLFTALAADRKRFYDSAYACMGLALMTKGLIGPVLPIVIFLIYLAFTGDLGQIRRMRLFRGMLIMALIFIPWGIAISLQEPEFSYVFFMQHQVERFTTDVFGRIKPVWFFVPLLFLFSLPWSLFLPVAIRRGLGQKNAGDRNKILFLVIWLAAILIFFSIPQSKLVHYILPLSMPLAILVGIFLDEWIGRKPELRRLIKITTAAVYSLLILMILIMIGIAPKLSAFEYARQLGPLLKNEDRVVIYASPDHFSDFPFYLKRRVVVAGSDRGTLALESADGDPEEMKQWFWDIGQLVQRFNARKERIYCLSDQDRFGELTRAGLSSYETVRQGHGRILIVNS